MGYPTDDDFERARERREPPHTDDLTKRLAEDLEKNAGAIMRTRLDAIAATASIARLTSPTSDPERGITIWNSDEQRFEETDSHFRERIVKDLDRRKDPEANPQPPVPAIGSDPVRWIGRRCPYCNQAIAASEGHRCSAMERQGLAGYKPWPADATTASIEAGNAERETLRAELNEERKLHREATDQVRRVKAEALDLQRSLDIVHDADRRGIAMWREAHPEHEYAIPDRAHMIAWLLEQLDAVTSEIDKLRAGNATEAHTHAASETLLAGAQRSAKTEIERLHRQIDGLIRQRNEAEERFNEANHNHSETSAALAAMTIKWLNLGNEAKALYLKHTALARRVSALEEAKIAQPEPEPGTVAKLRIKVRSLEDRIAGVWQALEAIPREICHFSERGPMDVEAAVEMAIEALIASRDKWLKECEAANSEANSLREQLRTADADRAPLAVGP